MWAGQKLTILASECAREASEVASSQLYSRAHSQVSGLQVVDLIIVPSPHLAHRNLDGELPGLPARLGALSRHLADNVFQGGRPIAHDELLPGVVGIGTAIGAPEAHGLGRPGGIGGVHTLVGLVDGSLEVCLGGSLRRGAIAYPGLGVSVVVGCSTGSHSQVHPLGDAPVEADIALNP